MLIEIWIIEMLVLALMLSGSALKIFWDAAKKTEIQSVSKYYFGLGLFFVAFAINGFLDFFEQYSIYIEGQNSLFPALHLLPGDSSTFYLMIPILQIAFVVLSFQIETYIINKTRKTITYTLIFTFILSLTVFIGPYVNENIKSILVYVVNGTLIPYGFIVLFWAIFYLKIALSSAGIVRSKALSVFFGLGFTMCGIIFDTMYRGYASTNAIEIWWIFPIMCKIIAIIGVPLLYSGFKRAN